MKERNHKQRALAMTLGLVSILAGCAGLDYRRDFGQAGVQGIRYYDVSPYIIIVPTPEGGLDARIEYLPDPNKRMAVHPKVQGAKLEATLTFDRGMLKASNAAADALAIPRAVLDVAKTVALGVLDTTEEPPSPGKTDKIPSPQVFKLIARPGKNGSVQWWLVGGGAEAPFEISTDPLGGGK